MGLEQAPRGAKHMLVYCPGGVTGGGVYSSAAALLAAQAAATYPAQKIVIDDSIVSPAVWDASGDMRGAVFEGFTFMKPVSLDIADGVTLTNWGGYKFIGFLRNLSNSTVYTIDAGTGPRNWIAYSGGEIECLGTGLLVEVAGPVQGVAIGYAALYKTGSHPIVGVSDAGGALTLAGFAGSRWETDCIEAVAGSTVVYFLGGAGSQVGSQAGVLTTPLEFRLNDAVRTPFGPGAGGDWVDPDPTDVKGALDRIAAVVAGAHGAIG